MSFNRDNEVVELICGRNPEGYTLLCQKYSGVLHGIIMTIVKDSQAAEVVLKKTCRDICTRIHDFHREQISFLTWTLQQARKASKEYLDQDQIIQLKPVTGAVELLMITDVAGINTDSRSFDLIWQGIGPEEIAAKLNLTVEAVRKGIRKGLKLKSPNNQ